MAKSNDDWTGNREPVSSKWTFLAYVFSIFACLIVAGAAYLLFFAK